MQKPSARALPSLSVRIDLDTEGRIGPGKIALLENIREHGSISAAGRAMDMSYKRAWDLVDEINRICRQAAVERQTGGALSQDRAGRRQRRAQGVAGAGQRDRPPEEARRKVRHRHCERSEAIHTAADSWIASSRSLSSAAHSRDPLAPRNDEICTSFPNSGTVRSLSPCGRGLARGVAASPVLVAYPSPQPAPAPPVGPARLVLR
jgi:hypothetical protein